MPCALGALILTLAILVALLAADAQPTGNIARIGLLRSGSPPDRYNEIFRQRLRELGWRESQNMVIEYRSAEGQFDRFPDLVAELVRLPVDALVTSGTPATLAAKQGTTTIPVVMAVIVDPVGSGIVASLARPGGNITGVGGLAPEMHGKALELLKAAVLHASHIAVLVNPDQPVHVAYWQKSQRVARALGVTLQRLEVCHASGFERAFAAMAGAQAEALFVLADLLTFVRRAGIGLVDLAAQYRLPALYGFRFTE